jgi:hypothetical protein
MTDFARISDEEFLVMFRKCAAANELDAERGDPHGKSFDELVALIREALIREMDMSLLARVEH